ncbi:MAG: ABC transporter permease, partial [Planctomycetota bacterium]
MNLFHWPLVLFRLLLRCVLLALSQIYANKGRSVLTTIGIVIGVASVTAVIAALSGLKTNVLRDMETFGIKKIYVNPHRPHSGPLRFTSWRTIRFTPDEFDGLLDHCPSVERFTRMNTDMVVAAYKENSIDAHLKGVDPAWNKIENRSVTLGRPFSLLDNARAHDVCLISPKVIEELNLDR